MYPMKEGDKTILKCRRCGHIKDSTEEIDKDSYRITTEIRHSVKDKIEVVKVTDDINTMPKIRTECPKCGHKEAVYWQLQTRSADEGMTTFYRCIKCKYTWRAY